MPGDYSEELVELVRAAVVKALSKPGELSLGVTVLDALSSSGRLVPEGSEVREEWRLRFDYADGTDGRLTTADGDEAWAWARAHRDCKHGTEMVGRRVITTPWTPTEPEEKPDA